MLFMLGMLPSPTPLPNYSKQKCVLIISFGEMRGLHWFMKVYVLANKRELTGTIPSRGISSEFLHAILQMRIPILATR